MLEKEVIALEPPPPPLAGRLGTSLLTSQSLFLSINTRPAERPNTAHTAITMPAIPPPLIPSANNNEDGSYVQNPQTYALKASLLHYPLELVLSCELLLLGCLGSKLLSRECLAASL